MLGRASVLALRGKDIPQTRVLILALKLVVNIEEGGYLMGEGDYSLGIIRRPSSRHRLRSEELGLVLLFSFSLIFCIVIVDGTGSLFSSALRTFAYSGDL